MPEQTIPSQTDAPPSAQVAAPPEAFAEIVALARTSVSHTAFLTSAMRCIGRHFESPYAAIHVQYASEVIQDDWHTGPTDPQFWKPSLQQFLTESLAEPKTRARLLRAKTGRTTVAFLSTPVFDPSGKTIGSIALVVAPVEEKAVESRLMVLESFARLASFTAEFVASPRGRESAAHTGAGPATQQARTRAISRAATYTSAEELAFAITNDLCNKLGCEQVSLGMVVGKRVNVISISGMDTVRHQSPGVVALRSAMEECLDANVPIVFQRAGGWSSTEFASEHRLHKQWHAATQGDAVASIPLLVGEAPTAVLSLRKRADEPFTADQIEEIRARVEPYAPALVLTRRASRGLAGHTWDTACAAVRAFSDPQRAGKKALAVAGTLFALWFTFGTIDYDLTVPCVVRPAQIRHITAPSDGMLASAAVTEGDFVKQGDVLCELDHRELDQDRALLLAELAVLERVRDRAMAEESPVEARLALAHQELVRAKLDIVNGRIQRATLRSPFDGVIVSGDLRKQIGSVAARGDPLFAVAPLDDWTLELEVPDSASADLSVGLSGFFASYARPDETREFAIMRVLPEAQIRQGRNVYVTEAQVGSAADWLRPGLEGVGKIHLGPRPVWWVVLHRAIDYLRMSLWL